MYQGSGTTGTINTFNYPNLYPGNLNCAWDIRGLTENNLIKLDFASGSEFLCGQDVLQVYDSGPSSEWIPFEPWCGDNLPNFIFSSGTKLHIEFESGSKSNHKGFRATYKFIKKNAGKLCMNSFILSQMQMYTSAEELYLWKLLSSK